MLDPQFSPEEIKRREVVLDPQVSPEEIKRREVELDPQFSPEEIPRREVELDPQFSPEEIPRREVELGLRVGLLLLQLFPNGGATDIVFVTLFRIAVGTAIAWYGSCCAMPGGHCLMLILAAVHGSLGLPGWRLFRGFTLLSPFQFPHVPVANRPSRLRER